MRKYIHKFKNYTSVEVDNLHDLKEGDLALYEDKFVTRNNGKVEEVVKGSGSSSEDEYSTDYPDDFYFEWIGDSSMKKTQSFKSFNNTSAALFPKETSEETLTTRDVKATVVHIHIENLNPKSVKCSFTLPEASKTVPPGYVSAYPLSKSFPLFVILTNKSVSHNYTMGSDSDLLLVSLLWDTNSHGTYSFMKLYFETKDGKKYKVCGIVPLSFSLYDKGLPVYREDNSKEFLTLNPTLDLL